VSKLRASGYIVRGLARRPAASDATELVTAYLADLPDTAAICDGIDVVFHLAAKTHDVADAAGAEADYQRTNVEGTRRLLRAAEGRGVRRIVFVSSVKAIDEGNLDLATETTPPAPRTPYGRSKLQAEHLVDAAAVSGGYDAVCLRFPLVYGAGQRGNLQRMLATIDRGRFPPPPANGNRRSMLHAENAVAALLLAATHPDAAGRTYIVTDRLPYSTREIFDAARAALGRPAITWHVPLPVFQVMAWVGDLARPLARRRVGFDI
jgi:nucleoside-diphosphate-sugar epimerase